MRINKSSALIGFSIIVSIFLVYFLWKLFVYIIIAAVISLILNPINLKLQKFHYKKFYIPSFIRAILLLLFFWFIVILIVYSVFPLIINEIYNLSSINPEILNAKISVPLEKFRKILDSLSILNSENSNFSNLIVDRFLSTFNISKIQVFLSNILKFISDLTIAIFVITFISFFFLKDNKLFTRIILIFVPLKYQTEVKHVLICISKTLMRYFYGVVIDMTVVFTLVFSGMMIVGYSFNTAIILGLISALFNIIPYIGPFLSFMIGMLIGFLNFIYLDSYSSILLYMLYTAIVYLLVNIIDGTIVQPFIYSNAIKANPLEIFIVIFSAGMLFGIIGMMVAVPTYMTLRIIAKEFFNQFYIVKKLTKNI